MLKNILSLLLSTAFIATAVELVWDRNPEPEVSGYKVHIGTSSRVYTEVIDVGSVTNYNLDRFTGTGNKYFFAVTAYATYDLTNKLESPLSDEVSARFLKAPQNIKIRK